MNETKCRQIVRERSGGACEVCGREGLQMHHRKNRSQGGKWTPANIMHVCVEDHVSIGEAPNWAGRRGYTVYSYEDPAVKPVRILRFGVEVRVLLDDEGGVTPLEEVA